MTDATRDLESGHASAPDAEPTQSRLHESGALIDRLGVIEGQALDERAAAYAQVHDELQTALEGGERSA